MQKKLTLLPLGGAGEVTKNMFVYETERDILLVDCGLGFPDETMLGIDLIIPDITHLLKKKNKIRGMVLTHGHEDHFGALPYILPQLAPFPIFASPLTSAFANEKLQEFGITNAKVSPISFDTTIQVGEFSVSFVRVTHSVPDSANIVIKTPVGTIYHGSDFKLDPTPADGKPTEIDKIKKIGDSGVLCLLCDSLRAEKKGRTPSEKDIEENFEREIKNCQGKFIVTTYSSNVSRLGQAIRVAKKFKRKVCFIGRSLVKAKEIALEMGYMESLDNQEIKPEALRSIKSQDVVLLIAGSQGQENSALVRVAEGEDKFVKITEDDVVVFSSDPIPGNEVAINSLIDTLSTKGARVIYSTITDDVHVSGHGARDDIADMIKYTRPKFLIPIGGEPRHAIQFRLLAESLGKKRSNVFLLGSGQEIIFEKDRAYLGRKIPLKNVYVDEITGEEVEGQVLRDRQHIAQDGIVIAIVPVERETSQVAGRIDFIQRGFKDPDARRVFAHLSVDIKNTLGKKTKKIIDLPYIKNLLSELIERAIFKKLSRRPLVLPIVIEV